MRAGCGLFWFCLISGQHQGQRGRNMRAYQLLEGGVGIDALVKVEGPDPKPSYRQVLVKVAACSLNFRDLGIVRGTYRMPVRDNIVPLSDGAGEVVEVGAGVTRVKVGDKVAAMSGGLNLGAQSSVTVALERRVQFALASASRRSSRARVRHRLPG